MNEAVEFLKWYFELGTSGFWAFCAVCLLTGVIGNLIRSLFSFIPKRIHFGGTQTVTEVAVQNVTKDGDKV